MTRDQIPVFDRLLAQMQRLDEDLAKLAATDASASVGTFKIERINELLKSCETFLGAESLPFGAVVRLTDTYGASSDATLVVGQYIECLKAWRSANVTQRYDKWYWAIDPTPTPPQESEYVLVKHPKKIDE